jgi:SAM-dependent methyltransferase
VTDLRTPPVNDGESSRPGSVKHGHPTLLFSTRAREYAYEKPLQRIRILEAGCGWGTGLDLGHKERHVTGVDVDTPEVRTHTYGRADLDTWHLGDLRTVPMPPRMYDIVHAHFLIERVPHAELILDRFVAALKPGGLLLMRFRDRATAYGFVDRALPGSLRALVWRWLSRRALEEPVGDRPEVPEGWWGPEGTPPPAIYEDVVSLRGMRWYCGMRGLLIAEEYTSLDTVTAFGRWSHLVNGMCRMVAKLSRGRLDADYSEVTLVVRKPENRFARVI